MLSGSARASVGQLAIALVLAACSPSVGTTDDAPQGPACGPITCEVGETCEGGECHLDCGTDARCGDADAEVCCEGDEVCHLGACTMPGSACTPGVVAACGVPTCEDDEYCDPTLQQCLPQAATASCTYQPPIGEFDPVIKWAWEGSTTLSEYNQVMMTPLVADLDGNCLPDVVFSTFRGGAYNSDGVLRVVKGDGSGELFNVTDPALRVRPGAQLALADVDRDGTMEIFACHTPAVSGANSELLALRSDGTLRWMTTELLCVGNAAPSVVDVDHDGVPEILIGLALVNSHTGALIVDASPTRGAYSTAAELDGDDSNGMELVAGGAVYHADGSLYWDHTATQGGVGTPAIGDLDGDGQPDIVSVVSATHMIWAYHHDGTLLWGPIDVNQGYVPTTGTATGGGPPTIADFDGDGHPDVATAGGWGYLVVRGATGETLWWNTDTRDYSSRVTGSSVFDFEGDGSAEAVYNDEKNLRVYRGATGEVLLKTCSTSGTLFENPVIVDVDGDDHADIVVMSNNYSLNTCDDDVGGGPSTSGFKVIGDAQNRWVRTRRIWNQHAYHVTNINDDGTVPTMEARNWTQPGLNNFRQNVQPNDVLAAPDLAAELVATYPACPSILLTATVINQGAASAPAGISVTFLHVDADGNTLETIGTVQTTSPLFVGATESVSIDWTPTTPGVQPYGYKVKAVIDAGAGVNQCDVTNDLTDAINVSCPMIL